MKVSIKKIFLLATLIYIIKANVNCAASVVPAIFIPLIGAANWVNADVTQDDYYNFITINGDSTNHATFEGNEHLNNVTLPFTGEYTNHDIKIKFKDDAASRAGKRYEGTINDASNEMVLTSPDGLPPTTLRKQ